MKALHILKIVLRDTIMSSEKEYIKEAIKELEDLQNRSCNNCKHYKKSSSQDYKSCYEIKINGFNLESEKCFYCNKWESK